MPEHGIKHFLITYDPESDQTKVEDSLETIKQTHSSYFGGGVDRLRELLAE